MIGFKDQAGAAAGVRSSERRGQESDFPWAEGGLGWWRQGVCHCGKAQGAGGAGVI